MKRGLRNSLVASGAAVALSLSACANGEPLAAHTPLSEESVMAINTMGKLCAISLIDAGANVQVIPRMYGGSTAVLETSDTMLVFTGREDVKSNTASVLAAIATGDLATYSWQTVTGDRVTINSNAKPAELFVSPNKGELNANSVKALVETVNC